MERRNFLKMIGTAVGGALFGAESPSPQPATSLDSRPSKTEPTATELETTPEGLRGRMSPELKARFESFKQELKGPRFGAETTFANASRLEHDGHPLMELVTETFRSEMINGQSQVDGRNQFLDLSVAEQDFLVQVCTRGQVVAESSWKPEAVGSDPHDKGLWQLRDTEFGSVAQIRLERGQDEIDPFDPTDATQGVAQYYRYLLRSLKNPVEQFVAEHNLDVRHTELLLPIIITAYNTGARDIHRALGSFEPNERRKGLDIFADFLEELKTTRGYEPDEQDRATIYYFKCLALTEIYDEMNVD